MTDAFRDDFETFDRDTWMPHYLPHWSSRQASAATWEVVDSVLRLTVPQGQALWCADTHETPLRVSGVQSGTGSGPVGSTTGQQPFRDGLTVSSPEAPWVGWAPRGGRIEVRARMDLSPRSMASVWMVGLEDEPDRCGELCLFEVFGHSVTADDAEVGSGVHAFRDPALHEDFLAPRLPLDVGEWHDYAADWDDEGIDLLVDGEVVRTVRQSPRYPLQMMIAVFDFPEWATPETEGHVPVLEIDHVRGPASAAGTPT